MINHRGLTALGIALLLSGCAALDAERQAARISPASHAATSSQAGAALPSPTAPTSAPAAPTPTGSGAGSPAIGAAPALASVAPVPVAPEAAAPVAVPLPVPPGTLYVCTTTVDGQTRQSAIELEPKVRQLCGRHPEMGVCQYAREACRSAGGRVHTAAGMEITRQTEAEYDRKVLRVRFRAG